MIGRVLFAIASAVYVFAVAVVITVLLSTCAWAASWATPGADAYTGTVEAALERYAGVIPAADLATIRAKHAARRWDAQALIGRDSITAPGMALDPAIRWMHWGTGRLSETVDRSAWASDHTERGLVYCGTGPLCVLIPSVCRNVSIVTRRPVVQAARGEATAAPAAPADMSPHGGGGGGITFGPLALPPIVMPEVPRISIESPRPAIVSAPEPMPAPFAPVAFAAGPVYIPAPLPPVSPVPEPRTLALLAVGIALIVWKAKRG